MQQIQLTQNDLKAVIAEWTGVPVEQLDRSTRNAARMDELAAELQERVIGQEAAIAAVVGALKRRYVLGATDRPIGGFLFVGPSGVGKTELAKALATALFGDENALIRFDMSEYQEKFTVSRLIGAPPGYVGYDEGGQLTEALKRKRFAVVLFDEVEKAHPDVFDLLLQLLNDGRLTDASGVTVDFRHTLVVLTSNLGNTAHDQVRRKIGLQPPETGDAVEAETQRRIHAAVGAFFRPEFLNRLDGIVQFRRFGLEELKAIARLELVKLQQRCQGRLVLAPTPSALDAIARQSQDRDANARAVIRTVRCEIEPLLIQRLAADEDDGEARRTVEIDCDANGAFHLNVRTPSASQA